MWGRWRNIAIALIDHAAFGPDDDHASTPAVEERARMAGATLCQATLNRVTHVTLVQTSFSAFRFGQHSDAYSRVLIISGALGVAEKLGVVLILDRASGESFSDATSVSPLEL